MRIGTFVVAMATSMSTMSGTAARRVSRPRMSKSPHANLDEAHERSHDGGRGDANLDEAPNSERVRVQELLDALRQEHAADEQTDQERCGGSIRRGDSTKTGRGSRHVAKPFSGCLTLDGAPDAAPALVLRGGTQGYHCDTASGTGALPVARRRAGNGARRTCSRSTRCAAGDSGISRAVRAFGCLRVRVCAVGKYSVEDDPTGETRPLFRWAAPTLRPNSKG